MYRQPPELDDADGRSGLLEATAARFAEEDRARASWLDARIHERRKRGPAPGTRRVRFTVRTIDGASATN
jgi:hypothetical protein